MTLGTLFSLVFSQAGLFAPIFYLICYLCSQGYATTGEGAYLLSAFWAASMLPPSIQFYRHFPQVYRSAIYRMRRYGSLRWLLQWSIGCIALLAFVYLAFWGFDFDLSGTIKSRSLKPPMIAYSISLFLLLYLYLIICSAVAEARGIRTSKRSQ